MFHFFFKAIVLFAMKNHNEAVAIVEQNIRNKPSDIQSHRILINFLIDLQQHEKVSTSADLDVLLIQLNQKEWFEVTTKMSFKGK